MKQIITRLIGLYLNLMSIVAPRKAGKIGFEMFCHPFRVPLRTKHLMFLEAATYSRIDVEGVQVQLYRWGNGPKNILLIHGWQSHSYRWKAYIEAFDKKEFSIFAFDAPGHGLSSGNFLSVPLYARIINEVVNVVGNVDCIMAHSLGSFSSVYYLFKNAPDHNIRGMVAMASPGEVHEFLEYFKKELGLSKTTMKVVVKHFAERFHHPPSYFSASSFAHSIQIPSLIIHDEEDMETGVTHSKRLHQMWKNSRLMLTKGSGHNLKSPEVLQEVLRFVSAISLIRQTSGIQ